MEYRIPLAWGRDAGGGNTCWKFAKAFFHANFSQLYIFTVTPDFVEALIQRVVAIESAPNSPLNVQGRD